MPSSLSCCLDGLSGAVFARKAGAPPSAPARMTAPASNPSDSPEERQRIDGQLLQRVARRDRHALAELYDRFSGPLYGAALQIVRDPAEAQDVVHDTFVALWQKAATFETTRGSAFSWAVTLTRNRAIDRVRMRRRRAELLEASVPADLGYDEAGPGHGGDAASVGEEARAVRAAVAELPADQRRALELAFFGGLTQEEIARKLSAPLGTVKARIRRGLLKLRDSLAPRS